MEKKTKESNIATNSNTFLRTILIFIVLIIIVVLVIYENKLNNNEKIILAEKSSQNFSWGFYYEGVAIFSDRTIYKWDVNEKKSDYKITTREERTQWILKYGSKISPKVTVDDLEEMKRLIGDLEDKSIEIEYIVGNDMGSSHITVWNSDNKQINLIKSGVSERRNESENSKKLISIINKYSKQAQ